MSKKQSAGGAGPKTPPPVPHAAPAGAKTWPPAMKRRTFWLLALIPLVVLVAMSARGIFRPFVGLHAWGQADSSVYARNHVRYGLGYTHGVMTMAMGYPPPPDAKRYYDHPQYGGLISAAVMWVFGINDWSVQLGFLLSDLVVMVLMMALLRRFIGGWQSLLSGLILAMMPISAVLRPGCLPGGDGAGCLLDVPGHRRFHARQAAEVVALHGAGGTAVPVRADELVGLFFCGGDWPALLS